MKSENNAKVRMIAVVFLTAVVCICAESIMGLHNAAVKALDVAVTLVSVFMLLSLMASAVIEKTNKKKKESD